MQNDEARNSLFGASSLIRISDFGIRVFARGFLSLNHLHAPPRPSLAVDHLAALFGPHAGAKTDRAGPFNFADLMGVMHLNLQVFLPKPIFLQS
jgi:hypothetical protein